MLFAVFWLQLPRKVATAVNGCILAFSLDSIMSLSQLAVSFLSSVILASSYKHFNCFFSSFLHKRLKSEPQATQWLGSAWYCSKSKLRALNRSWSADFCLAWWPGQPRSADDVTNAREGRYGGVYGGWGNFYFLVNCLRGNFSSSEYIEVKNKVSDIVWIFFCPILLRLNFVVHWRSLIYHVTKAAMSRSKAWWWVGCSLRVRRWTSIKSALWNPRKHCVYYRLLVRALVSDVMETEIRSSF